MRKIHLSLSIVVLFATALAGTPPGHRLHSDSSALVPRIFKAPAQDALQLAEVRLSFKGKPVNKLVSGNKVKKYSMELTGTGFVSGSRVIVSSIRAYLSDLSRPEAPVATTYESATALQAQFLRGSAPPPGLLLINILNPDGKESNTLGVDVISAFSDLSITSISPESGPSGTLITLRGVGFAPSSVSATTARNAAIRFTAMGSESVSPVPDFAGFYIESPANDNTLTVVVPDNLIVPICPGFMFMCDPIRSPFVTPQQYRVQVINSNGMSNSLLFQVTAK